MNENKQDKQKQLDKAAKSRIKGLGLDALFHLVDTNQKDHEVQRSAASPRPRKAKNHLIYFKQQAFLRRFYDFLDILYQTKKNSAVGISIDTSAIKLVEIKKDRGKIHLTKALYIPIPQILKSKADQLESFIVETLHRSIDMKALKNSFICSLIHRNKVIVKFLTLPTQDKAELENMIIFEAEHRLHFPLHELEVDYQIIKQDENKSLCLLVAARKDEIDDHLNLLNKAKIQPDAIDISSLVLHNAMVSTSKGNIKGTTLQIHIGSEFTDINISRDGILESTRGFQWGSHKLTQDISKKMNTSIDAAEKIKKETGIILKPKESDQVLLNASAAALQWCNQLIEEVNKTLHHFHLQEGVNTVDLIILSGGGSRLINLPETLKEKLKVRISAQEIPDAVQMNSQSEDVQHYFHELNILLGLAERTFQEQSLKINLLPRQTKKTIQTKHKRKSAVTTLLLLCFALLIMTLLPAGLLMLRQQRIDTQNKEINTLIPQTASLKELENKIQIIDDYMSTKQSSLNVMREITMLVSADIIIKSFSYEKNASAILSGEAGSHNSVVNLSRAIRESQLFNEATLRYTRRQNRENETVDFEIVCALKQ